MLLREATGFAGESLIDADALDGGDSQLQVGDGPPQPPCIDPAGSRCCCERGTRFRVSQMT